MGEKIRKIRELRGLTGKELAEKSGMKPATISALEVDPNIPASVKVDQTAEQISHKHT